MAHQELPPRTAGPGASDPRITGLHGDLKEAIELLEGLSERLETYRHQLEPLLGAHNQSLLDALPVVLEQWDDMRSASGEVLERMRNSRIQKWRRTLRPQSGLEQALRRLSAAHPDFEAADEA